MDGNTNFALNLIYKNKIKNGILLMVVFNSNYSYEIIYTGIIYIEIVYIWIGKPILLST